MLRGYLLNNSNSGIFKNLSPLYKYNNQSNGRTAYSQSQRYLSYVDKCKYVQKVKEDDHECVQLLPQGKFLAYRGSRPLLKSNPELLDLSFKPNVHQEINWLSINDLADHKPSIMQTSVLLDVNKDKIPQFGVQLGKLEDSTAEELEKSTNGTFVDLRAAFFMVNWSNAHILSRANALLMFQKNNAFCGRCGGKTKRNAAGNSRVCTKCKFSFYPQSNPVGIVLVTDPSRQRALLVRQPRHPPGMYSCVAGFADVGESLEETVRREVAEEVGVEVQKVEYVLSQHWPFPGSLMAGCYAVTEQVELNLDLDELECGKWFSRDDIRDAIQRIQENPFLRFKGTASPEEIFIPPPGAIAYYLIYHWYHNTPIKDIYTFVK